MENETFEIEIQTFGEKRKRFKMQVEIFHRSEQVIRFKISAGTKIMIMEKLLMKHTGQWKIKETNFQMTGDVKDNAESIMRIQEEIEYYLKGRPKWENKFKNKP
jgi:hypothetical protein